MKKLFFIILFCVIVLAHAEIFSCIYTKCITAARFVCTPVRLVMAPFFELDLSTQKDLHRVMLLELAHVQKKRMQKQCNDPNEYFTESFIIYEDTLNIRAKLFLSIVPQATKHDALSIWEKVFTNRQQQLHNHCKALYTSLKRYDEHLQKSSAETARKMVEDQYKDKRIQYNGNQEDQAPINEKA
jgi:hypothetical protein